MNPENQKMPVSTRIRGKLNSLTETLRFDNRWQLLFDELIAGRTLRVYRLDGIDAIADHKTGDHLGGIRGVLASNEYRRLLSRIPLETVRTVIDLGAHVGGFMLLLKALRVPIERAVCVEPNPVSRVKLQFNLQYNQVPADIFAGAVSDHSGAATLNIGKLSTGFSLLADHPNLDQGLIEVETTTFDTLVAHYFPGVTVDICKMDVEGAEFAVLLGQHAEALENCRFLICEIHRVSGHATSDLVEAIRGKGFELVPVAEQIDNETVLFKNVKREFALQSSPPAYAELKS